MEDLSVIDDPSLNGAVPLNLLLHHLLDFGYDLLVRGLGIEPQREPMVRYLNGGLRTLSAEYVEIESGRRSDRRLKLASALSHAKAIGAKLVFAKLDRLTPKVDLLRSLVATVELTGCFAATLVS